MPVHFFTATITYGSRERSFRGNSYLVPLPELIMELGWQEVFDLLDQEEHIIRKQKSSRVTATVSVHLESRTVPMYLDSSGIWRTLAKPVTETRIVELRGLPFGSIAYPSNFHAINASRHEYVMTSWYDVINDRWYINPTSHVIDTSWHEYDLTITFWDYDDNSDINLPVIAPDLATAKELAWDYARKEIPTYFYEELRKMNFRIYVYVSLSKGEEIVYEEAKYIALEEED